MMIELSNRLVENNLDKNEILENIEITSTSYEDAPELMRLLAKCFGIVYEESALRQLIYSDAQLDHSVKAIDKRNGDIYGFLILSKFPIHIGSPIMHVNAKLGGFLIQFSQINGHSFILDERLRGTGIDKKMLMFQNDFLDEFEMVWIAVEESLGTDNYWKRLGFRELFSIPEATFFARFNDKIISDDIYKIIEEFKNETNHYKRE